MANLLPPVPPDDERLDDAICLSDGVPLYLVCFARALRPQLFASSSRSGSRAGLPAGLVEIVRGQIAHISVPCREVLRAIARSSAPALSRDKLVTILQQPSASVQNALDELIRRGMLREVEPDVFAFTHQVVRIVASTASLA